MTNQDYEKAKAECWDAFWKENFNGKPMPPTMSIGEVFDFAFAKGYESGSKCFPNGESYGKSNGKTSETTTAKPKYRVGEIVTLFDKENCIIDSICSPAEGREQTYYLRGFPFHSFKESDLKPYIKVAERTTKSFPFVDSPLSIAATIMGHIIQSGFYSLAENCREKNITDMAKLSMQITDALIAECEKGGHR